jgi:hypothetical protein
MKLYRSDVAKNLSAYATNLDEINENNLSETLYISFSTNHTG